MFCFRNATLYFTTGSDWEFFKQNPDYVIKAIGWFYSLNKVPYISGWQNENVAGVLFEKAPAKTKDKKRKNNLVDRIICKSENPMGPCFMSIKSFLENNPESIVYHVLYGYLHPDNHVQLEPDVGLTAIKCKDVLKNISYGYNVADNKIKKVKYTHEFMERMRAGCVGKLDNMPVIGNHDLKRNVDSWVDFDNATSIGKEIFKLQPENNWRMAAEVKCISAVIMQAQKYLLQWRKSIKAESKKTIEEHRKKSSELVKSKIPHYIVDPDVLFSKFEQFLENFINEKVDIANSAAIIRFDMFIDKHKPVYTDKKMTDGYKFRIHLKEAPLKFEMKVTDYSIDNEVNYTDNKIIDNYNFRIHLLPKNLRKPEIVITDHSEEVKYNYTDNKITDNKNFRLILGDRRLNLVQKSNSNLRLNYYQICAVVILLVILCRDLWVLLPVERTIVKKIFNKPPILKPPKIVDKHTLREESLSMLMFFRKAVIKSRTTVRTKFFDHPSRTDVFFIPDIYGWNVITAYCDFLCKGEYALFKMKLF